MTFGRPLFGLTMSQRQKDWGLRFHRPLSGQCLTLFLRGSFQAWTHADWSLGGSLWGSLENKCLFCPYHLGPPRSLTPCSAGEMVRHAVPSDPQYSLAEGPHLRTVLGGDWALPSSTGPSLSTLGGGSSGVATTVSPGNKAKSENFLGSHPRGQMQGRKFLSSFWI